MFTNLKIDKPDVQKLLKDMFSDIKREVGNFTSEQDVIEHFKNLVQKCKVADDVHLKGELAFLCDCVYRQIVKIYKNYQLDDKIPLNYFYASEPQATAVDDQKVIINYIILSGDVNEEYVDVTFHNMWILDGIENTFNQLVIKCRESLIAELYRKNVSLKKEIEQNLEIIKGLESQS